MNNKDILQQEALKKWKSKGKLGTIVIPTGGGKTRVGVLAAVEQIDTIGGRVLIIVPTTNLRDNEWRNEFIKWGYKEYLEHVTIECIQTAHKEWYKYVGHLLMIVDEIHTSLSEMYFNIYKLLPPYVLGLTATPPEREEYREKLAQVAPLAAKWNVADAIERGLISPYILYNLPIRFTRKERAMYNKFNQMFNNAQQKLITYIRAFPEDYGGMTPFDLAQEAVKDKRHPYHKVGKQFWQGMSMRRWACYKAENKLEACMEIIQRFPDKKWIVFSKTTEFVDKLNLILTDERIKCVKYHSKMSKADKEEALDIAKDADCRVIISAEALNAGYDLPAIDGGICASAPSTMLNFIQQLGQVSALTHLIRWNLSRKIWQYRAKPCYTKERVEHRDFVVS